jgi:NAD(P)-dependent dehydrogenase (short-subunit alcohol dehydrogenase family)
MGQRSDLAGRVVVVTGGARGVGEATARLLTTYGASVAICDREGDLVAKTAAALGVLGHAVDVTDPVAFATFLDEVEAALGPIDVLVNNAGIMPLSRIEEETRRATRHLVAVNLLAVIEGSKEMVRRWKTTGRAGHLVNVSSAAGRLPVAGAATYTATKHGVSGFTNALHVEFTADRTPIHATVVHPAIIRTELSAGFRDNKGPAKPVTAEQVAAAIVDLLQHPQPEVYVPRGLGVAVRTGGLIPRRVGEWLNRVLGGERAALDALAHPARRSYQERVDASVREEENHE